MGGDFLHKTSGACSKKLASPEKGTVWVKFDMHYGILWLMPDDSDTKACQVCRSVIHTEMKQTRHTIRLKSALQKPVEDNKHVGPSLLFFTL